VKLPLNYADSLKLLFKGVMLISLGKFLLSCAPATRGTITYPSYTYTELKLGTLDPKDTGSGAMIGLSMGKRIDNRLWWGFEGFYFKSSYSQTTEVPDEVSGGSVISTKQVELDYSTSVLSFFVNLSYERRFDPNSIFYYRASAGLGWEFIWNEENNYVDNVSRNRSFNTPGAQFTTGLGLGISQTGLVFADLVYNFATAKSDPVAVQGGLPIYDEINISGFGFRLGVNIWNLSFF
jgi:hypothetical protein